MAAFEAWLVFLILVVNVVGELQRKRTLAASRGFLAAARLSCMLLSSQFRLSAVCNASASQLPTVNNELPDRPRASIIGRNTSTRRFVGDSRASLFAK